VNQAQTTTTLISHTPDPSLQGQGVTVSFTVTAAFGTTPTGNVTVSDGVDSCTASVATGSCTLNLTTLGIRTLTASYEGDSAHEASASPGDNHTVI
jgi:hypothetical protein